MTNDNISEFGNKMNLDEPPVSEYVIYHLVERLQQVTELATDLAETFDADSLEPEHHKEIIDINNRIRLLLQSVFTTSDSIDVDMRNAVGWNHVVKRYH